MLASTIESFLVNTGAETLTNGFLIALIVSFGLAIGLKRANRAHAFTQYAPTLLTTLGILGTFAGIISGLLGFDVDHIDESIGALLAGLKTAFTTSLVGMALSIGYKLLIATGWISPKLRDDVDEDEIGIGELYTVMRDQAVGIESLRTAIGGDTEASLISQIKLMRSDIGDQHKQTLRTLEPVSPALEKVNELAAQQQEAFTQFQDQLWLKLQEFADMMSRSATEQVINALKEVISDFNNNLVEQFGDSFKELNAAVFDLVKWQENYKQQLLQMTEQYQQGVQAITQTESAVSHISEESRVIPASMQELKSVMEVNQHQLQELQRHLEAFKDIRDRAVEAVPEIRNQIDETVNGMKAATAVMTEGMVQTTESLASGLKQATETVTSSISESAGVLTKGVTESAQAMQRAITDGSEEFVANSQRVNESLKSTSDVVTDNTDKTKQLFDDALSETNAILRTLVADLKDDSVKLSESYKTASQSLVEETDSMRSRFVQGLEAMRQQLGEELKRLAEQQAQENQRVLRGLSQHADGALKDTAEAVQKQVKMLDDALEHELTNVMRELGRALTTISGKFTSDYQQLVNEMHKVTRMRGETRV